MKGREWQVNSLSVRVRVSSEIVKQGMFLNSIVICDLCRVKHLGCDIVYTYNIL